MERPRQRWPARPARKRAATGAALAARRVAGPWAQVRVPIASAPPIAYAGGIC